MKRLIILSILLMSFVSHAQQQLTLEECYQFLNANYPLAKQSALLEKKNAIDLEAIITDKLPQFDFSAQATYQSDVIEIPIPNSTIEPLNNDQYRATVSVNQLIYGGGLINASLEAKSVALKTQLKQVEVNLYQLKKQVNQLYFSVLLLQENRALLTAKKEQLQAKLKEVRSGIKNGIILPTSDKILEAELLKIEQQFVEVNHSRLSLLQTLSSLIGKEITTTIAFENPIIETDLQTNINRPELELFQLKKEQIESSEQLISKQNAPKLVGFATGGYGNPGLDMLDNSFKSFYTVGVKLNWNVFDWNANKKQRQAILINNDILDNETEIFKLNTNIELNQQESEIKKTEAIIVSDIEIIKLRKEVLKSTESQLKNGVITASEYITELTNLYEDQNVLNTHKIELMLVKANYNITKGH